MTVNKVEKKEKSIVEVAITVTAEEFEKALQQAYFKNKGQIMVPGFRKGKAPRKVIEGMYGSKVFYEDALEIALPDAARDAFIAEKLIVVGYPDFKDVNFEENGDVSFVAAIAVFPEVTLGDYKGISVYKAPVEVTDEDVNDAIEQMRQRNSRQVTVDRAIKEGDTAVIDFDGYKDGVPFEGGKGTNHPLTIGSGSFVPGFEEQLVGKKAGEEVTVALTFPEDYHADLAGAAVEFKVTIHEVKETQLPELDDEFAKDVSEFDTLEELRIDQKSKIAEKKAGQSESSFREDAIAAARNNMTADIPDVMVEDQLDAMMNQFANSLRQQGFSVEQYTQIIGISMEQMRETYRPMARDHVLADLMLHAVADAENIEVTDEEADAEYAVIAETYGVDLEEVKKNIAVTSLKEDLRQRKAADFIVTNAVATDVAPVEEKAEEAPAKKPAAKKTTKKAAEGETAEKKPAAKKTTKKAAEGETAEKKPAAKKTTKKAAEGETAEKKPAAKKTTKKAAEGEAAEKKPAAKKTTKKAATEE